MNFKYEYSFVDLTRFNFCSSKNEFNFGAHFDLNMETIKDAGFATSFI